MAPAGTMSDAELDIGLCLFMQDAKCGTDILSADGPMATADTVLATF